MELEMEGRSAIPQAQRRLKFQDKIRGQEHCRERYAGLSHIERQLIANKSPEDPKRLRNIHSRAIVSKGIDVNKDHKCISHSGKGGSLQDKALNVGVLNWDHTGKWKHNLMGVVDTGGQDALSTNSKLYYESYAPPSSHKAVSCSNHSIISRVGFAPGVPNGERIVCLLSPRKPISDMARAVLPMTDRSSSRSYSRLHLVREEPKRSSSSNLKDDELHISSKVKMPERVYETKKILDMLQKSRTKNLIQIEPYSEIRRTISKMQSIENPNKPKKVEKMPNSSAKLNDQFYPRRYEKTIVPLSKDGDSTLSGDSLVPESLVFADEALGLDQISSSYALSCERGSLQNCVAGISESSPRPHYSDSGGVTSDSHPNDFHTITVLPKVSQVCSISTDLNVETPDDECEQRRELTLDFKESSLPERSIRLDQAFLDKAAPNSRNPSPLRQLSNGFSRMRKSLSSKDGLITAPSNSKRFPRSIGIPSSPVDPFKDKADSSKNARSSPLRRLIDPILKSKVAITSPHVDEHSRSAKETKMVDNASVNALRFSQIEKKKKGTVQALLQYSTKNGLPMFKLVAKKKGDALVATMPNMSSNDKHDLSLTIIIYSINEMTNNSSWMYQGRTGKNCGYLYNIVGQMKLCMPSSDKNADVSSREQFSAVESTLFGVQPSKTDRQTVKIKPSGELAALVIKTPINNVRIQEKGNNREKLLNKFRKCLSEDSLSNMCGSCKKFSTTVVLPAGVHSMPNKGAPSPLLHRWRSGGSCDCGGWDVGCNINLFHDKTNKEHLELFSQTGAHGKDPSFRLTPIKNGIYSVVFEPSTMSELQALFISVTVLSSQVAFDIEDAE